MLKIIVLMKRQIDGSGGDMSQVPYCNTIKSKEDWWNLVEQYKEELYVLVTNFTDRGEDFTSGIEAKDWMGVWASLSDAWFKAPDTRSLHSLNGWGLLCDLCSENWVFQGEE